MYIYGSFVFYVCLVLLVEMFMGNKDSKTKLGFMCSMSLTVMHKKIWQNSTQAYSRIMKKCRLSDWLAKTASQSQILEKP